jgi:hypothetical protein
MYKGLQASRVENLPRISEFPLFHRVPLAFWILDVFLRSIWPMDLQSRCILLTGQDGLPRAD